MFSKLFCLVLFQNDVSKLKCILNYIKMGTGQMCSPSSTLAFANVYGPASTWIYCKPRAEQNYSIKWIRLKFKWMRSWKCCCHG